MKDYYYILGVTRTATTDEIKKAYRKLSLKFHPDKNDGDTFFTERFKDINEAYEILSDEIKRKKFDLSYPQNEGNHKSSTNIEPVIDYFKADKTEFEYNEKVTISWRTVNTNKVKIYPFGEVEPIGQHSYHIKDFKHKSLTFSIQAENTNINRKTEAALTLKNKTYHDFYSTIKSDIENEHQHKADYGNSSLDRDHEILPQC